MIIFLKRIIKSGWANFRRYGNLSFATCFVLVMTTILAGFLFLSRDILDCLIKEARDKADISVYFQEGCAEEKIFETKEELNSFSGVETVKVKSKQEALEEFIEKHSDDPDLIDSLIEVGTNPFLASLNIKASEVQSYKEIESYLKDEKFEGLIEKVDYYRRKPVIQKIFNITVFLDRAGIVILIIFIIASVLITFNTIRLAISGREEEISIMRLVGASNSFIRGPFLVQGVLCGILSFVISFIVVGLSSYFLTPRIAALFSEFHIFNFFKSNLQQLILVQIATALILGICPSLAAIRKYLWV